MQVGFQKCSQGGGLGGRKGQINCKLKRGLWAEVPKCILLSGLEGQRTDILAGTDLMVL